MNLKPKYQKIFDDVCHDYSTPISGTRNTLKDALKAALETAQALAYKPPKELTDAEIQQTWDRSDCRHVLPLSRAIIAAHIAKQREPVTAKLRMAKEGFTVRALPANAVLFAGQRWVSAEFDSPPIEGV